MNEIVENVLATTDDNANNNATLSAKSNTDQLVEQGISIDSSNARDACELFDSPGENSINSSKNVGVQSFSLHQEKAKKNDDDSSDKNDVTLHCAPFIVRGRKPRISFALPKPLNAPGSRPSLDCVRMQTIEEDCEDDNVGKMNKARRFSSMF